MSHDRIQHTIERSILALALVFPLLMAFIAQTSTLFVNNTGLTFWVSAPLALVFLVYLVYLSSIQTSNRWQQTIEWIIVVGFVATVRILILTVISSTIESDFWDIHRFAVDLANGQGLRNASEYTFIPRVTYLNTTAGLLSIFYRLFGDSVRVGKMVMVGFSTTAGLAIYFMAKRAFERHAIAIVAILLFAFWPALVAFTGMTSPDHIAIFLIALVFFLSSLNNPSAGLTKRAVLFWVLLAIAIGLVDWFRPVGIVLALAVIFSDIIYTDWRSRRALLLLGARTLSLWIIFSATSGLSVALFEWVFHQPLQSNRQRMGESLYIGMNVESGGMYSLDDSATIVDTQRQNGSDADAFNRRMLELAADRFKENLNDFPRLLIKKFMTAWSGHQQLFEFALHGSNDQEMVSVLEHLDRMLTPAIFLAAVFSIGTMLFIRPGRTVFAMVLFVLGFAVLLLVTEVQNRYRLVLVPVLVTLGSHGFSQLSGWVVGATASMRKRRPNSN